MRIRNRRVRSFVNSASRRLGAPWIAFPPLPPDRRILFFGRDREDFAFLSNFYPCRIHLDGRVWPHSEAWYQAQKSENPAYREKILRRPSPGWAKRIGDSRVGSRRISRRSWFRRRPQDLRSDWDEIKEEVMRQVLAAKFSQNPSLRRALVRTVPAELVEDSPRDLFWGSGRDGSGRNTLGRLLMELRETLLGDRGDRGSR